MHGFIFLEICHMFAIHQYAILQYISILQALGILPEELIKTKDKCYFKLRQPCSRMKKLS